MIMIEARELRIGNIVNVPREDQCPFIIDLFEYFSNEFGKVGHKTYSELHPVFGVIEGHPLTWELTEINPIPLTEQWLLDFGFTNEPDRGYIIIAIGMSLYLNIVFDLRQEGDIDFEIQNRLTGSCMPLPFDKIHYVHQLQNLYFILTGTELTFKTEGK